MEMSLVIAVVEMVMEMTREFAISTRSRNKCTTMCGMED